MRLTSFALSLGLLIAAPAVALAQAAPTTPDCMSPSSDAAATVERATYRSRGREIQGLLYRPVHPNGAGIVLVHDREGIQEDLALYEAQVGRLASCGYTVLAPSYYDAAPPRSVNDPLLGDKWMQVIDEGINHLAHMPGIDPARIGVWGHGRGGNLAITDAMNGIAAKAIVAVSVGGRAERGRDAPPILLISGDHNPDAPVFAAEELARTLRERDITVTVQSVPSSLPDFDTAAWDATFAQTRTYFDAQLAPTR